MAELLLKEKIMSQELFCYQNGKILPASQLCISPWDLGFLRGYGVFDVLISLNGKPFLWEWHFERLEHSALELGLVLPVDRNQYHAILQEVIGRNVGQDIIVRTVVTGGVSQDAFTREKGQETFLVLAEPLVPLPQTVYTAGAKVMTLPHIRRLPKVKLTQYVEAIRTLDQRQEAGALETLYVQDGIISECAQSNFFIVKDGTIITTTDNALGGITQKLLCEVLIPELGLPLQTRTITYQEVLEADEAFLTGSNKHIVPVVRADDAVISDGKPGPLTRRLMEQYWEHQKRF